MQEAGAGRPWADRIERALVVFVGAAALGPLVPALVFIVASAAARFVPDGATSVPALPFVPVVVDILRAAYQEGGAIAAAVSGFVVALLILVRGVVRVPHLVGIAALVALGVGWTRVEASPGHFGAPLVLAYALVAALSARVLARLGRRLGLLDPAPAASRPPEADFASGARGDSLPGERP